MIIKTAQFVKSSVNIGQCPPDSIVEYAFIGRSNVGKSSLINMLTDHSKLAKTSGTPGKTKEINHFIINDSWYLVDLPGYGYAKISKTAREKWEEFVREYILKRENLVCLFVLVDGRHEPQKIDLEFIDWLGENEVPFTIVFTKLDKLSRIKFDLNKKYYLKELRKQWDEIPMIFQTSSETQVGKAEILQYIEDMNEAVKLID